MALWNIDGSTENEINVNITPSVFQYKCYLLIQRDGGGVGADPDGPAPHLVGEEVNTE